MPVTFPGTGSATLAVTSGWPLWNTGTSSGQALISQAASSGATTTLQFMPVTAASGATTIQVCTDAGTSYPPAGWEMPPYVTLNQAGISPLRAEHRQEDERARQQRIRVTARARELLFSLLTDEQARTYRELGWFELRGSAGGWWRIRRDGQAGNVDELPAPGAHRVASWCCHPPGGLPDADAHAAQYLTLVTDEPGFRATGNRTPRPWSGLQAA